MVMTRVKNMSPDMILTAFDRQIDETKDELPPEACRPPNKLKKNNVDKVDHKKVEKNNVEKVGHQKVKKKQCRKGGFIYSYTPSYTSIYLQIPSYTSKYPHIPLYTLRYLHILQNIQY